MIDDNDFRRQKLIDYYANLNLEGEITELEMENEMDNVSFSMTNEQIKRKYNSLKKLKAI